nr:helix-turn-helix transcriptional regulator [Marvinbryantia formatexigens]
MIKYKFDVGKALETAGMTAYKAQKTGVLSQDTWRKIKHGNANISMESLNRICAILHMQPEHLIYYESNGNEEKEILEKFGK